MCSTLSSHTSLPRDGTTADSPVPPTRVSLARSHPPLDPWLSTIVCGTHGNKFIIVLAVHSAAASRAAQQWRGTIRRALGTDAALAPVSWCHDVLATASTRTSVVVTIVRDEL